jgi:FSR family fosmidomycin resistance protein-like MFS transporter
LLRDDGSVRIRSLVFNSLGHFANDGMNNFVPIMAAILVVSVKDFSLFYVGILTPVFYVASTFLSTFVGRRVDRGSNPGRLIGIGIALLSLGLVGFYLSVTFLAGFPLVGAVLASAVVMGFGSSVYHPISATIMRHTFKSNTRGKAMGVVGAAGTVGSTIYPSLFVFSALLLTDSGSLILLAAIGFILSVSIWLGLRSIRIGDEIQEERERPKTRDAMTRGILILTVITAVRSISTTGFTAFLPTYITANKGIAVANPLFGLTLSSMYAAGVAGQLFFGALMDRIDKRMVLGIGSVGSAVATLGYISTNGTVEFFFVALFGFFTFSNFPTLLTLAAEYVPAGSVSLGNAVVWGYGITGGNVIGPLVVAAIVVNNYSLLTFSFAVMAAFGLAGAVMTPIMPKPGIRRRRTIVVTPGKTE